jgi:hypothetical protein
MPGYKPPRVLSVMANITGAQVCYSVYPYPADGVYGHKQRLDAWVNYYVFGGNKYQITIVSPLPSAVFDRETALHFATAYASHKLEIIRYDLNTAARVTGLLDIDSERFIPNP